MKLATLILLLSCQMAFATTGIIHLRWIHPPRPFPPGVSGVEQYGTGVNAAGNTSLKWKLLRHADVPRPWGIVVHGGEYKYGDPGPSAVCQDLYDNGWNCVAIQYRLAEPANNMRPPGGNQPAGDHGYWPELLNDVSQAIIACRTGSTPGTTGFTTGVVFGIGGSAGGQIVSTFVAAPYAGGDQLDCAVALSGLYDFKLASSTPTNCGTNTSDDVFNLFGCAPGVCDGVGGAMDLASSKHLFGPTSHPFLFFQTIRDSMPPTQYATMLATAISSACPCTHREINEPDIPGKSCTRHSFHYWYPNPPDQPDSVKDEAIAFVNTYCPPP